MSYAKKTKRFRKVPLNRTEAGDANLCIGATLEIYREFRVTVQQWKNKRFQPMLISKSNKNPLDVDKGKSMEKFPYICITLFVVMWENSL